jgi:hypothetical protein
MLTTVRRCAPVSGRRGTGSSPAECRTSFEGGPISQSGRPPRFRTDHPSWG